MRTLGKFFIMVISVDNDLYDYVFIGSSPLSLIHALYKTKEAPRLLVLNKEDQLGGCWSWTSQDGLEYECAAHLIEAVPGVYELLEQASGVQFVNANWQPERQFCGLIKFKMAYFSKFFLFGALAKISLEFVLFALLGRREEFFNSRIKLKHWFSVNLGLLVSRLPRVKVPETGYVSLIRGLIENCRENGVEFQEAYVVECSDVGDKWLLKDSNGKSWKARHLVLSSSVSMVETTEVGRLTAGNEDTSHRLSIILEIADENRLRPFSYVSLFHHKFIRRVVDVTNKNQTPCGFGHYLFELSMTKNALESMSEIDIDALAVSSCLFKKTASARLRFSCDFEYCITPNVLKSRDRLTILDSFGNLAVGVKAWGRL